MFPARRRGRSQILQPKGCCLQVGKELAAFMGVHGIVLSVHSVSAVLYSSAFPKFVLSLW